MDKYVIKERRVNADSHQTNNIMTYAAASTSNNSGINVPDNIYFSGYSHGVDMPLMHPIASGASPGIPQMTVTNMTSRSTLPNLEHTVMGIDPRYLPAYSYRQPIHIVAGQENLQRGQQNLISADTTIGSNYLNRSFVGVEKHNTRNPQSLTVGNEYPTLPFTGCNQVGIHVNIPTPSPTKVEEVTKRQKNIARFQQNLVSLDPTFGRNFVGVEKHNTRNPQPLSVGNEISAQAKRNEKGSLINTNTSSCTKFETTASENKKKPDVVALKDYSQNSYRTRMDKLKALHKSGPRVFSGPVEKVLKWHKALQEVGVLILYELVAKCVSVRSGECSAKNLVVRDENGPAMQVVYYEIDFLLPELKVPCTIRVIGRMMPGTCRLQAFNVRLASGDDVATLPRRAAVAAHHVNKLSKEYSNADNKN